MEMYFILVVALFGGASCMYSATDDVVTLTPNNFNKLVIQSDELWLIEFYAPWCGHCQRLTPDWKKAATGLKGVVKIGAVDADEHKSLGGQYGVQGFPTIKMFGLDKNKPTDYQGARTAQGVVDAAVSEVQKIVKQRMGGKSGSGGGGSGGKADTGAVVELTDSNFEKLVLESDDMWLVEFFAPWCGHCKSLAPEWAQAASQLKGKVKLGAVDATVHTVMGSRYNVRGYPTIKYFPAGKKSSSAEEYDGGRKAADIVSWALDRVALNVAPPEVNQVTSADTLKANCEDKQLCILVALPHILDCQSACRNKHIKMLLGLGEHFKTKTWGWVWSEGGAQLDMEDALGIGGFGYPALTAVNTRKMKHSIFKGSFSHEGIKEFLRNLSYGKGSTEPVREEKLYKIATIDPWDGKDGELPVEEDYDLSDVELDDIKEEL